MHEAVYFCVPDFKVDGKTSLTYYLQFSDEKILGRKNMSSTGMHWWKYEEIRKTLQYP
jgi:hypothetical protein